MTYQAFTRQVRNAERAARYAEIAWTLFHTGNVEKAQFYARIATFVNPLVDVSDPYVVVEAK